jgi:hypothetical protein
MSKILIPLQEGLQIIFLNSFAPTIEPLKIKIIPNTVNTIELEIP